MNLRLNDNGAADLLRGGPRFFLGMGDFAARDPYAVARKNLLGLILVYFHVSSLRQRGRTNPVQTSYFIESRKRVSIGGNPRGFPRGFHGWDTGITFSCSSHG